MSNIFVISDTHFGHANMLNFTRSDGSKMRNFASVEEMDEFMVDRWNSVVRPQDKVYHLGDVAMAPDHIHICSRLQGHKRLVLGNHDQPYMRFYTQYFQKIFSSHLLDKFILTHIPIHPENFRKQTANIHGHVHNSVPQGYYGPKYYNVSVEMIDYTPISLEDLKLKVAAIS